MLTIESLAHDGENAASEESTPEEPVLCLVEAAQSLCDGESEDIPFRRNESSRNTVSEVFSLPAAFFAFHILLDRRGIIVQVRGLLESYFK